MIRRPPRSTLSSSSAASDVYKRQVSTQSTGGTNSQDHGPDVHSTRMMRARVPPKMLSPRNAWVALACYWALGAAVMVTRGYLSALRMQHESSSWDQTAVALYFLTAFSTVVSFLLIYRVGTDGGRPWVPWVSLTFAVCNGTFETIMFMFSWDCGRAMAPTGTVWMQVLLGFASFSVYGGVIHALWWEPFVLPPHLSTTASKADRIAFVSGFTVMGTLWTVSYTHLRAHETVLDLVCRLLLEKKKKTT
eukprot:TRINITY_DN750_c0_g1_i2.p1 TRINITY_DN750_c0_g1~~TRINITY_DN750_c0_g1_i2.p1  ORF type:complete len:248 (-),score=32.68 TRINITY_DN750_c0_g1_i2:22-765(-)